jgi:hypothetical protein
MNHIFGGATGMEMDWLMSREEKLIFFLNTPLKNLVFIFAFKIRIFNDQFFLYYYFELLGVRMLSISSYIKSKLFFNHPIINI